MPSADTHDKTTDAELVKLALSAPDYFLLIMKRYEDKLRRYIMRISGLSLSDADDVLQETFIKVYYNLNDFDQHLKFASWIYRIAHNETISEMRRRQRIPLVLLDEEIWLNLAGNSDLFKETGSKLDKQMVQKLLSSLDEKYRSVLTLYYLEEKDYEEISDILRLSVNTVGTRLRRGKKIFKQEYEKLYGQQSC